MRKIHLMFSAAMLAGLMAKPAWAATNLDCTTSGYTPDQAKIIDDFVKKNRYFEIKKAQQVIKENEMAMLDDADAAVSSAALEAVKKVAYARADQCALQNHWAAGAQRLAEFYGYIVLENYFFYKNQDVIRDVTPVGIAGLQQALNSADWGNIYRDCSELSRKIAGNYELSGDGIDHCLHWSTRVFYDASNVTTMSHHIDAYHDWLDANIISRSIAHDFANY